MAFIKDDFALTVQAFPLRSSSTSSNRDGINGSSSNNIEVDSTLDWTDDEAEIDASSSSLGKKASEFAAADMAKEASTRHTIDSKLVPHFVGMGFSVDMVTKAIQEKGEENTDGILNALLANSTSETGTPQQKLLSRFVGMGFSRASVSKALEENDEENSEAVLETILNYSAFQDLLSRAESMHTESSASVKEEKSGDDSFSEKNGSNIFDEEVEISLGKNKMIMFLVEMGYSEDESTVAAKKCGEDATIADIQDTILAAQVAKKYEGGSDVLQRHKKDYKSPANDVPKRRSEWVEKRFHRESIKKVKEIVEEGGISRSPDPPRIGFGVPNDPTVHMQCREIPDAAVGPPFFYYENIVATNPKSSWGTILSRWLFHIKPEFIDSRKDGICAVASTRGYIHNLPMHDRFRLEPQAPLTIQEALPHTKKWWPSWDMRTQLSDIQGKVAGSKVTDKIRVCLSRSSDPPPPDVQKYVLSECKRWNLVWVGFHKLSSLEPDEMEMLMGFPRNHTRGGGMSGRDRYRCLGNSFQIDALAYHLSATKNMFPNGIRVLSLFSGIGAAELSLHRLGIPLKLVVSVEHSAGNRDILKGWWEQTDQKGTLIDMTHDIRDLTRDKLERLISSYGGFDLVIGGSPCNNLSRSDRMRGDGLAGDQSSFFFDFFRVLDEVMRLTKKY